MEILHALVAEPVAVLPRSELVRFRVGRELLDHLRDETAAVGLRLAELEALANLRQAQLASVLPLFGRPAGRLAATRNDCQRAERCRSENDCGPYGHARLGVAI